MNRYIANEYGNIRNAKRALGVRSSARARGLVAERLGDSGLKERYFQRAEAKAAEARAMAVDTASRLDFERRFGSSPELRQSTAEKVVADLQASKERINNNDEASRASFKRVLENTPRNPGFNRFVAESEAMGASERLKGSPLVDRDRLLSEVEVKKELRLMRGFGVEPDIDYFSQDEKRARFLVENSENFKNSFEYPDVESEIFVRTRNKAPYVSINPLKDTGVSFLAAPLEAAQAFEAARNRRKLNKSVLEDIYREQGVIQGKRPNKSGFLRRLTDSSFSPVLEAAQQSELIYSSDIVRANRRRFFGEIKGQLKEAASPLLTIVAPVPALIFGKTPVTAARELQASPAARLGAGSVAYTVGSVPVNAIPGVGGFVAETIDIGLAAPGYAAAFVNPSPRNVAAAQIELVDVGIDFVPEALGLLAGGAGVVAGAAVPTPNVNLNANFNPDITLDSDFGSAQALERGGLSKGDVGGDGFQGGPGGLYVSATGIPFPSTNTFTNFNSNFNQGVNFGSNVNSQFDSNASFNSGARLNVSLLSDNNNISLPDSRLVSSSGAKNSVLGEVNVDENVNSVVESSINSGSSSDFSSGSNAALQANINNQANAATNANLNLFSGRRKDRGVLGVDRFQSFAKVKGVFTPVGEVSTSRLEAFEAGKSFVDITSSRTFGVSRAGKSFKGLDLDVNPGFFRRKRGSLGTVFVEPSRLAINSPVERSQITFKGLSSRRASSLKKSIGRVKL